METNKLELINHGTMLQDYFSGTSNVMLSISIDNTTTIGEAIEYLENEVNAIWDHIEYTAKYQNYAGDLEKDINNLIQELKDNNTHVLDEPINPDLDFSFDDIQDEDIFMEYPVLIMSIEFIEE